MANTTHDQIDHAKEQYSTNFTKVAPIDIENGSIKPAVEYSEGELEVGRIQQNSNFLRKLKGLEEWLDKKLKIEGMGAERVLLQDRRRPNILYIFFFWMSMMMSPGLLTMGLLGPEFGLSVNESIWLSVIATATGCIVPAFTATLSAPLGLRQIAASRYAFGIWGAKLCAVLNIVTNIGFGTISCIVAGQLLSAVSGGSLNIAVGIIVVVVSAFVISFFGFKIIQSYESVAWVFILALLCVQYGQSAKYFSHTPDTSAVSGIDRAGAALTYFAIVFGENAAWCSISGDYYVHFLPDINKWLVFGLTWFSLTLSTCFVVILGVLFGGIVQSDATLAAVYEDGGIGALILETLRPSGWAKFVCVFYAISFVANVVAIFYSASLSLQLLGKHFLAVPRFLWNVLLAAACLALAWGGRNKLETIFANFLPLLGYWTLAFGTILAIEHFWFRPRIGGYDAEVWQDYAKMPLGIAGTSTLLAGIGFSFLGMSQTWFIGPVAKHIAGGDVGNYFVLAIVLPLYPALRHLEIKWTGR